MAVLRRLLDDAHVADAAHRHVEGARDGGRRKGQHVDGGAHLLEFLLVPHAEPLFLVDDAEAEVLELDVVLDEAVGADDHVDLPAPQLGKDLLLLLCRAEAGEQLHLDREALHPAGGRLVMLPREDGRGTEQRALLAVHHAFEGGPERHLRLAEAHVAAEQPVHRDGVFHIRFDLVDAAELVVRLLKGEPPLKVVLPVGVGRKRVALDRHPLGIEFCQLLGHVLDGLFDPLAGLLPLDGIQFIEAHVRVVPHADVFADEVELGDRHEEHVGARVADFDVVLDNPLHVPLDDPLKHADAVGDVHDVVPRRQIADIAELFTLLGAGLPLGALHDRLGLRDDRELQVGVFHARRHARRDDVHHARREPADLLALGGADVFLLQILRQRHGGAVGSREDDDAVAARKVVLHVLPQQGELAAPGGELDGVHVDHVPQRDVPHRTDEGVEQHAVRLRRVPLQIHEVLAEPVAPLEEDALLEQDLDVLVLLPEHVFERLAAVGRVAEEERPVAQIVEDGRRLGIEQRQPPVEALGHDAVGNPRDLPLELLLGELAAGAADVFHRALQKLHQPLRAVRHHLGRRGDVHPLDRVDPALGVRLEGGDRVDLVPPEFNAEGVGHVGREKVEDAAPLGELADAVHLVAAGVARRHQKPRQLLHLVFPASLEGPDAFFQHLRGHRILKRGLRRRHHDLQAPRVQPPEHRQARMLIFV